MSLKNEQTYRIKVKRDEGKMSVATVTIPVELLTLLVIKNAVLFRPVCP